MSALCQKRTFCTAAKNVVIRSSRRHERALIAGLSDQAKSTADYVRLADMHLEFVQPNSSI